MPPRPNILLFLPDGMQKRALDADSQCHTPHFDRFAATGVRFHRAHCPTPTCSPSRASLMTGLLAHNHGVLEVEHGRDDDQCVLRTQHPHWAQRLVAAGYRTAYFGKWHIERTNRLEDFGWQHNASKSADHVKNLGRGESARPEIEVDPNLSRYLDDSRGYNRALHYGVTETPASDRYAAFTTSQAIEYLSHAAAQDTDVPWCCCVSFSEPNEALIVSRETWEQYDVDALDLPPNLNDDLADRPNIYRRQREISRDVSERQWREALACYYGRITELDDQFGRLLASLESSGQRENTIVIVTSDHGRYVGAHGFDAHNFGAFEEIYNIPLLVAGPGIARGEASDALVGLHDLCPTILALAGAAPIDSIDAHSFAPVLADPADASPAFDLGYAEYHGTRFGLTQRIVWSGPWKFVFNGFDFDELYHLADDPHETRNLAADPAHADRVRELMTEIWRKVRDTGDRAILESHYYSMRFASIGPNAAE